jgi:hypothetical protein
MTCGNFTPTRSLQVFLSATVFLTIMRDYLQGPKKINDHLMYG